MGWIDDIAGGQACTALAARIAAGGPLAARGLVGSSAVVLTAALARRCERPMLLVVAHIDEADEAVDELEALGLAAVRFPAVEVLPGESAVSPDLLAERLSVLRRLADDAPPPVIVAPIHALMQVVPPASALDSMMRVVRAGDQVVIEDLAAWLIGVGYKRVEAIESPGEFAVRGGIIDAYLPGGAAARIDLFGEEVESLFDVDVETMGSDRRLDRLEIVGMNVAAVPAGRTAEVAAAQLPERSVAVVAEIVEINEQGRSYLDRAADARGLRTIAEVLKAITGRCHATVEVNQFSGGSVGEALLLPVEPLPAFAESAAEAVKELAGLATQSPTVVLCQNDGETQRMRELLAEHAPEASVGVQTQYLHRGFGWAEAPNPVVLVPYHELLHRYHLRRHVRRLSGRSTDRYLDFEVGDLVVHRDHGIARFRGLDRLKGRDGGEEFLTLEFAGDSKLHVPASRIELVQKYLGSFRGTPELSKLGGRRWAGQKQQVAEAVRDLAGEMLRIQAARAAQPGIRYPADTPWQREFEAEFPYEETEDQLAAIAAVKRDMASPRPADRLICGDVGFGKTEVAIRAAFKAAEFGKQVAVLVPTTVLAEQHERTFRDRFADYPFRIESLSRFKTKKQQTQTLQAVRRGQVDILIGTHRLLSGDVAFADLGLVVIDEEQRFGVEHKHKLLSFRLTADVLTLSATPIPRTLHMAMLNLRDISSLTTPPLDRRAIVTEVSSWDPQRVRRGIQRELAREGQVFFVHNRVYDIRSVADTIQQLVPEARVIVGHGQMGARQLESVMLRFLRREADVLVCTTIIESGIDIPTANTMFVTDADMFGLSELHQLRGRVGRYKHRAYCYLMLPVDRVVNEIAVKRLHAIEQFSMLGAGFRIALRDLEIRGAGNLLGPEQSGHIAAVGYDMYCRLLEQAVSELKNERKLGSIDTTVDLGVTGGLPRGYIPSTARRMEAYRRFSQADSLAEIDRVEHDLTTAYGPLPAAAVTLSRLARLRVAAALNGIRSVTRHEQDVIFDADRPAAVRDRLAAARGTVRLVAGPDGRGPTLVYYRPPEPYFQGDSILTVLLARLGAKTEYASVVGVE